MNERGRSSAEQEEIGRLRRRVALLEALIASSDSGISVVSSDGVRILQNAQYEKMLGVPRSIIDSDDDALLIAHILRQLAEPEELTSLLERIERDAQAVHETTAELADGSSLFLRTGPLHDSDGVQQGRFWILRDETELRQRERNARYLAHHDQLTGLPNRERIRGVLERLTARIPGTTERFALLLIDLNRFRAINENYGQSFGDALLQQLSRLITSRSPQGTLIARYGTDQFMLLLRGAARQEAETIAGELHESLNGPLTVIGRNVQISAAVAGTCFPEDGLTSDELLNRLDLAVTQAKAPDTRSFCFYTPELGSSARRRMTIEQRLRECEEQRFELVYQPKVNVDTGALVGGEALLRWRHDDLGSVSPAEFIPIAEESGSIVRIGDWVLRRALGQISTWQREGLVPVPISVNISARQFRQQDVIGSVEAALRTSGVAPALLELELTESLFADDPEYAIRILGDLGDLGVRLSLDDFGTGFSNLSYLQRIRFDTLKIDGSFIRDIEANPKSRQIVRATAELAHGLGMRALAEHVEDETQARLVHELRVDEVQGFYFGRPVAAELFGEMMRDRPRSNDQRHVTA